MPLDEGLRILAVVVVGDIIISRCSLIPRMLIAEVSGRKVYAPIHQFLQADVDIRER